MGVLSFLEWNQTNQEPVVPPVEAWVSCSNVASVNFTTKSCRCNGNPSPLTHPTIELNRNTSDKMEVRQLWQPGARRSDLTMFADLLDILLVF
mmetsp:Transcript_28969/g.60579  ORF Transcript_28969/g.60579 Transcript_28969/m.60579 type:complete len:93 (+) Transcript_28969:358-636(+)